MLDVHGIIEVTHGSSREQALKLREDLRRLLRTLEDMHSLPHSFQTKGEMTQREIDQARKQEHHNR
jgi:ferredoxin-NADP reductase